jgi:long-subunit fatty acid transport protein
MSYNDKFYAGILLGMATLNYRHEVVYEEYAHENNISDFDRLVYNTDLKISGYGINYKLGIIYKPVQSVRLGFSFHSPDYFLYPYRNLEDEDYTPIMDNLYSASMETYYKSREMPLRDGPGEEYYLFFERIKTPYKATASFAYVFGKLGLISADCEYTDYSRIKLKGNDPVGQFNSDIKNYFNNTLNLRFGTELWIKNFALRAGYMYNQSPDKDYDLSRQTCSAGFGCKFRQLNIDFAYTQTNTTDYYTHHIEADRVTENLKHRRFSITFGWTFNTKE